MRSPPPPPRGCGGAERSAAFSRYRAPWWGAELERALRAARAAGWVGEGQSRQPRCQAQPRLLVETSARPAAQKGALLLRLEGSQKPLLLSSPRPLPPSPGLGQAVAREQKGAFVWLLRGDRALRGRLSARPRLLRRWSPLDSPSCWGWKRLFS